MQHDQSCFTCGPESVLPAVVVLSDLGYNDLLQTMQELLLACSIGPRSAFVYV